ncbi:tRNA (adenosine(37)-N6)-threonylcarbamoyltransferase complex dimerization subunit type 1 TsaB [Deinococcus cavernae]|uniref:tRNA (Adenosine(37)-N6)-threonylcarbamoyltransferase complex dimerization subunit type 1 TsaB n=1 Tax=Deinococcus cavernae TaxID=2320857 RepID=A0A418VA96_9DEIO|nr:tRNA (adenosine(37)-N6)-threonylcarbamoyltransferase complex dimerization subunit type 1 TsaB [Deinococcus cavernae]RJF72987.1 tRNA (adenosine(37)-N6)-threonylcarbamoyltransferase complex dimerization subunit type 1 TsaB [Deinococcus cavernae]
MPVTLALDTATPFLTLALAWEGGTLEISREVGRAHAERLADATRELFGEAGLPFRADTLVIGTGPGSYTGVRVGASYALGLGRVWSAPVLGVSTLEGLVQGSGRQAVSQDARKGNVYSAVYDAQGGVVQQTVEPVAKREATEFTATLDGLPHHQDTPPSGLSLLRAGLAHGVREWQLAYL